MIDYEKMLYKRGFKDGIIEFLEAHCDVKNINIWVDKKCQENIEELEGIERRTQDD